MSKYDGPIMPDRDQDNNQVSSSDWSTEAPAPQPEQPGTADNTTDNYQPNEATPPAYIPATENYYNDEKHHNRTARKILLGAVAVCAIGAVISIGVTASNRVEATSIPQQTATESGNQSQGPTSATAPETTQTGPEVDNDDHESLTVDELKQLADSDPDRVADDNKAYGETLAEWMYTHDYSMMGPNYDIVNDNNELVPEVKGGFGFNDDNSSNESSNDYYNRGKATVLLHQDNFEITTYMSLGDYDSGDMCHFVTDDLPDMEGLGGMVRGELESR